MNDRNIELLKYLTIGNRVSQELSGALTWLTVQRHVLETVT